ncbi:MAG: hypothetical protein WBV28_08910, partial [Terracidiphilus sp.]
TPVVRVKVAGVAATPAGAPLIEIWTFPLNPVVLTTVMLLDCATPPAVKVALEGLACSVKSETTFW